MHIFLYNIVFAQRRANHVFIPQPLDDHQSWILPTVEAAVLEAKISAESAMQLALDAFICQ